MGKGVNKKDILLKALHGDITEEVPASILQKHKNITVENIQSDKMIKKVNGYFINPYSFKEYGGSDIFYVAVLRKQQ